MQWDIPTAALGVLITTCAGGGLWFVVRLMWGYQHNVTDAYVAENSRLKGEILARDQALQQCHLRLMNAQLERGALRALVRQNDLPWNPSDWGVQDDTGRGSLRD